MPTRFERSAAAATRLPLFWALALLSLPLPLAAQRDDATLLAEALGRFGARVLEQLPAGNLCYSPASASLALMMCFAGAAGDTASEMATALAPADWDAARIHAATADLQRRLSRSDKGFTLACAQDVWPQTGHALLPTYITLLQKHHDSAPRPVDFAQNLEGARKAINARVGEVTRGRIPELLTPSDLAPATRLVLTNALYLKADWRHPFAAESTRDQDFHLADGKVVATPMMRIQGTFELADTDGMLVVRLPYIGNDFALDVALPTAAAGLAPSLQALVATADGDWRTGLKATAIALGLPRFRIENRMQLNEALEAAGIRTAFGGSADFRGIDGQKDFLRIDLVLQKTWIDVAEKGTEAAAATVATLRAGAAARAVRVVTVDRPFAFALRDLKTGLVLFAGRCVDPRAAAGH